MNTMLESGPIAPRIASRLTDSSKVEAVSASNVPNALAALTLAFAADPAVRWLFPDPGRYLSGFPSFARAFGGGAFEAGTATSAEEGRAVAL